MLATLLNAVKLWVNDVISTKADRADVEEQNSKIDDICNQLSFNDKIVPIAEVYKKYWDGASDGGYVLINRDKSGARLSLKEVYVICLTGPNTNDCELRVEAVVNGAAGKHCLSTTVDRRGYYAFKVTSIGSDMIGMSCMLTEEDNDTNWIGGRSNGISYALPFGAVVNNATLTGRQFGDEIVSVAFKPVGAGSFQWEMQAYVFGVLNEVK